ncbi:MAG: hypothetical protein B6U95_00215 [Thermofilum sp. ex4484_82]|nr:MAG: hypothetical protein B6U95_00215 [Thermofilum sp. ex4484_82]OYT40154.1 MAG: hypothetical protein B6U96_00215 [Archaeoglobales archaeon ex4484_92]
MVKCPFCGKEVEWLKHRATEVREYIFEVIDGEADYHSEDLVESYDEEYRCPHCGRVIARSEDEAIQFLTGEG